MKLFKKIMSFSVFLTLLVAAPVSAANPNGDSIKGDAQQKKVTNEYLNLKNMQKMNDNQLKSIGLKQTDINDLKSKDITKEYGEHIKQLSKYSEKQLKQFNYTDDQIYAIKHYDGSEKMTASAASSVSVYTSKASYTYSNGRTNAAIDYSFSWDGIPFYKFTDALALCWSEGLYVDRGNTYLNVYYRYNADGSNTGKETYKTITIKPEGAGNIGGKFEFATMISANTQCIVTRGNGRVYLYKNDKVSMFGLRASYMHKTITPGSPSISYPGGVSISAGTNTTEEDYSLQYHKL